MFTAEQRAGRVAASLEPCLECFSGVAGRVRFDSGALVLDYIPIDLGDPPNVGLDLQQLAANGWLGCGERVAAAAVADRAGAALHKWARREA